FKHEPTLLQAGAGSIYWPEPWAVRDPGDLVSAYCKLFQVNGGRFVQTSVKSIDRVDHAWRINSSDGIFDAPHVVIALGIWSPDLLAKFGLKFPMIFKRGYHAHYDSTNQLNIATLDSANGYMMAPMRAGIRITTGTHLTKPGGPVVDRQLMRAEQAAREFVELANRGKKKPCRGTRPCSPVLLSVMGPVKKAPALWLILEHGHKVFPFEPAPAKIQKSMRAAKTPPVDSKAFRAERF